MGTIYPNREGWSKGVFTLEAAILSGLMLVMVSVIIVTLAKTVYKGGLEALFNYADNNFTFQTENYNLRKGSNTDALRRRFKLRQELLVSQGESERQFVGQPFKNVVAYSHIGRRLLVGQVVVTYFEKNSPKEKGKGTKIPDRKTAE